MQFSWQCGRVIQDKATYKKMGRHNWFDDDQLAVLHNMFTNLPSIFLDELQKKMSNLTGKNVSKSTIWCELHECLALTLHKTCSIDPCQSPEDQGAFVSKIAGVPAECLVFIGTANFIAILI
ncbi:hypothetical protein CROQUDRAFT_692809 [Cronartium quercuum f. sp. fusiforme G11]|uniref:Uncharacterized protein n=1 Tax=Cronartium quercuum f. sp. fusiforme G11 TaxID=708437 RepID=A0A9P6T5T2_9BASI|nr:hypothetical protein CROQUDRAFT_692809 [Cronartium quercuum f. sp. fusiforme G11]